MDALPLHWTPARRLSFVSRRCWPLSSQCQWTLPLCWTSAGWFEFVPREWLGCWGYLCHARSAHSSTPYGVTLRPVTIRIASCAVDRRIAALRTRAVNVDSFLHFPEPPAETNVDSSLATPVCTLTLMGRTGPVDREVGLTGLVGNRRNAKL